jgi:hypothetical protein
MTAVPRQPLPHHPMRSHPVRRSWLSLSAFASAVAITACVGGGNTTTPSRAAVYAILFGHVTTPTGTVKILVKGQAYIDSAKALAGHTDSAFGSFGPNTITGSGDYLFSLFTRDTVTLWFNVEGQGTHGSGAVFDTVHAVRVRFDSLGGGRHDSVAVNLNLH